MSKIRNIKYICETLELTRRQVASIVGKSVNTINQYASDNTLLSLEDIINIRNYLARSNPEYENYRIDVMREILGK